MNNLFIEIGKRLSEAEVPYNNYELVPTAATEPVAKLSMVFLKNKITEVVMDSGLTVEAISEAAVIPDKEFKELADQWVLEIKFIIERHEMR